jgi:Cu+-exporting ATPase
MRKDTDEEEGWETAKFQLEGLGCSCEAQIVEKRLKRLKGVKSFALNPVTNRMTLTYDSASVTIQDIQKAVAKAGLKAVLA